MDASSVNSSLDRSFTSGQIFIGSFLTTAFWGMSCLQTLTYFLMYKSDPWYLKTLVIVLLLLDTLHEALCIQGLWELIIPRFGDLVNVQKLNSSIVWQVGVTGLVVAIAQLFFTWRLWRYSNKNWIYPAIVVPPALFEVAGNFVYTAKGLHTSCSTIHSQEITNLVTGLGTVCTIVDIFLALMMCRMLWRGRTGVPMTDKLILRLVQASISTGACTVIFALINLIGAAAWPNASYYILGEMPISSLYCNVVVANLNSRNYMRKTKDEATFPPRICGPPIFVDLSRDISVPITQEVARA